MKRIFTALILLSAYCGAAQAQNAQPKLSARTRQYLLITQKKDAKAAGVPNYIYKKINNKRYISSLIKAGSGIEQTDLDALGILTGTKAGNIWTVQIPVENVEAFTKVSGVDYIQLDVPVFPVLDSARKVTRADSAQRGINLPMPMTGKNVVMGIIDAGFDFNHPIMYDTSYSQYRIKKVWNQKLGGTPPAGFSYGNELTDTSLMKAQGYDTVITSHGTHVAGIAAGSGYGGNATNNKYRGMAYESDLVLVGIMPDPGQWVAAGESDIIDGINYIFNYATSVGKPAVVNLSWGSTLGSHDGNSLFSQACDALTGAGKIFVCAAGNNGADTVHLQKAFTATNNTVSTFVTFSPYLDSNHQETWVDIWGDPSKTFCLKLSLYNGAAAIDSTINFCLADTTVAYNLVGSNGDTCFVNIFSTLSEYNGKPHAFVSLYSRVHDNICLTTSATEGVVDMWEGYVAPPVGYYGYLKSLGYPWAVSGDTKMTVSDIGCTRSAITVGAYTSKTSFVNISGTGLAYSGAVRGRIAPFSSLGPTGDYRIKPDITAPGFALTSAVSSRDSNFFPGGDSYNAVISADTIGTNVYRYAILAGTSMASPCVAGIVAMMLQLNPTLTPDSTKSIINLTAIKDGFTGALPAAGTTTWGHGKINAYGAVKFMAQQVAVKSTNLPVMDCILYPNPNNGHFTLRYTGKTKEQLTITTTDMNGKIRTTGNWPVNTGSNIHQLDISTLPAGTYLVRVTSGSGFIVIKVNVE
ncbi:MAG: S8 family peptidase [Taibaiella sp.]|nr:S8 family peptidase [Taibaiella sp.]